MPPEPAVLRGQLSGIAGLLDALPSPLLLIEPGTARILFANRAAHRVAGGEVAAGAPASRYEDVYPCFDERGQRLPADRMPGVRAARGESFDQLQLDWEAPGGRMSILVSGGTVVLPDGAPVAVLTYEDVTPLVAARRRTSLLAAASALLAGSLDYEETLAAVARLAVPAYADWCFVELRTPDGRLERVVAEHEDPDRRAGAREHGARFPPDPDALDGWARVIRTGEPELLPEIPDELLQAAVRDPEQLRLLRETGVRSSLAVPLRVRGAAIGALVLVTAESGRRYDEGDLRVAQELADRCAAAIDNARLYTAAREAEAAARRSTEELHAIIEGIADAVTVQRPDGRLVFANAAAVRLLGFPDAASLVAASPDDVRGRFDMRDEDGRPLPVERLPGRRALVGERPEPLTVRFWDREREEERWSRLQAAPVYDEHHRVRLAINVIEDITDLKRTEQGHRFLAEASRVLADSLDYEETLRTVARLAVPHIADWCAVDLATSAGIERVAVAHVDPARVQLARDLHERFPPHPAAPTGIPAVLRSGRPELYRAITDEILAAAAHTPEHLALMRSIGLRSAMLVPMRLRDRVLGVVSFVSAESGRRFDEGDLALAEDLALRAAAAVDNARLYRTRSVIAQTLQASLLPPELPELPGLELAAAYRAAGEGFDVGGDFYDVFSTGSDQWYVVMGDVCGKGAEAAAVTALARYTIRAAAVHRRSPSAILRWLNDAMVRQSGGSPRFCTIACLHLDMSRSPPRVTVSCGGHPLPVLARGDGTADELGVPGTLLGLLEGPELQDRSIDLRAGDALVLYTDGLTEAGAPHRVWSPRDLLAAAAGAAGRPAGEMIEHLLAAALVTGASVRDDVAVLVVRAPS